MVSGMLFKFTTLPKSPVCRIYHNYNFIFTYNCLKLKMFGFPLP